MHGSFTLNANGSFTYKATNNYTGIDTFTYRASDGVSNSALPYPVMLRIIWETSFLSMERGSCATTGLGIGD